MNDAWYVAEPDGTTHGPMSRDEVVRAAVRNEFGAEAMTWHVDIGEWVPLAKILLRFGRATQDAPSVAQVAKAQQREDRQKQRELPPSQRSDEPGKANADERKRRVAETLRPLPKPKAPAVDTNAAAESAARLGIAGKRLLARYLDLMSIGLLAAVILLTLLGDTIAWPQQLMDNSGVPDTGLLLWLAFVSMLPLEAVLIATFGTTPGKSLLGLRVESRDGAKPAFAQAWARAFGVFARGCAFGIPLLSQVAMLVAGGQTLKTGTAPWDEAQGLRVRGQPVGGGNWKFIIIAAIVLWIALADGWWLRLFANLLSVG